TLSFLKLSLLSCPFLSPRFLQGLGKFHSLKDPASPVVKARRCRMDDDIPMAFFHINAGPLFKPDFPTKFGGNDDLTFYSDCGHANKLVHKPLPKRFYICIY